jgi:hypothetical protein
MGAIAAAGVVATETDTALTGTLAYSQSLLQWALLGVGGTVALLIGTTTHRSPPQPLLRLLYYLFPAGWALLGVSIHFSTRVHQAYLAYYWSPHRDAFGTMTTISSDLDSQESLFFFGVGVLAVWLIAYVIWWIHTPEETRPKGADKP